MTIKISMSLIYFFIFLLILIILALAGFILSLRRKLNEKASQELDRKNAEIVSNITNQIQLLSQNLGTIQKSVDQRLGEHSVSVDRVYRSFTDVKTHLVSLHEETKKLHDVGKDIASLQEVLKTPKMRGGLGEFFLENMLKQVLSRDQYELQYSFKSGDIVDAIVKLDKEIIPVDSKFPLENFKKTIEVDNEDEKKMFAKQFLIDVRKHIDSISKKYILPGEGTTNFAFMYIPAENVYHQMISHNFGEFYAYATRKKVFPVSPSTFYVYLVTVMRGIRQYQIAKNISKILQEIGRIENDFRKIRDDFLILGGHLKNAHNKYIDTEKKMDRYEMRLEKTRVIELEEEKQDKLTSGQDDEQRLEKQTSEKIS
ncbi:MAG: hypothetical protein COZ28_03015 [Candidatus Moranbacteria bacterium CG_4_10_14_3_um_filter_44_15]|nr:MAG: hypothetical protein COS72_03045 [Candidatus Moranbacteria bacterium CG06_land_8_20_14_3_00_43_56]PIV83633.1 MAG: hypothetical protein COW51_03665 [Candidatus Moranbacteria bacterium CG17_big_fil_post_rev_8_21_14_2_50_44_12]PIW93029.1 MAG: hypothetical protein COZ87_03520 [Candidatus Moranbacteria bacterium CG_4_8_14_3_um_filter_43_15]PIX90582.1 MAG: hypothetical protein COZ28_03015 [Candidatus Moranbacteria bacterium CG_4_10_14_3_um_filter_44_15]PJA86392.1 MAG: hypothetical protein CO1